MKLDMLNIIVADMTASVEFYRLLGLEIPDTLPQFQDHHRTATLDDGLDLDLDSVEFAQLWNRGAAARAGGVGVVIGFRVDSRSEVDEAHARVAAGGHRSQQEPYDAFWGARYAVVEDPDGNAVGVMSPVDQAMRTPPPPFPGDS